MFALVVSLHVKPEKQDRFLQAIEENSRLSVQDEPACLRFDVVQDQADSAHFFLYEIYQDEAGFQAHTQTPHFARWRQAAAECLVPGSQQNSRGQLLFPQS